MDIYIYIYIYISLSYLKLCERGAVFSNTAHDANRLASPIASSCTPRSRIQDIEMLHDRHWHTTSPSPQYIIVGRSESRHGSSVHHAGR